MKLREFGRVAYAAWWRSPLVRVRTVCNLVLLAGVLALLALRG